MAVVEIESWEDRWEFLGEFRLDVFEGDHAIHLGCLSFCLASLAGSFEGTEALSAIWCSLCHVCDLQGHCSCTLFNWRRYQGY